MSKTTKYEICNTTNKNHLNGSIELMDNGDGTGTAEIIVMEKQGKDIVKSIGKENIYSNGAYWHTIDPHHKRYNGDYQEWKFFENSIRTKYPNDNKKLYLSYIGYKLTCPDGGCQGNGTGTAGGN